MQFVSAVSEAANTADAVACVIDEARAIQSIDLAALFITAAHADEAQWIVDRINTELEPQTLVGCAAEGVIGGNREIERAPGITLLVGSLPGVRLSAIQFAEDDWNDVLGDQLYLMERLGHGEESRAVIGFGDPFTCPIDGLMQHLNDLSLPLIGGMASAGQRNGETRLFMNNRVFDSGFVGVTLNGPIAVESIVSQGCRPVGDRFVVTKAHENIVEQLGGKPAIAQLRSVLEAMTEEDRQLLRYGLYIGRAIDEYRDTFGRGDFLIRNVMQLDQASGAIVLADYVRVGQTVQFQVRDAATADEDLRLMLSKSAGSPPAACAMLFGCNGRGTRMFPQSCHDVRMTHEILGNIPVGGFFAAGELGPVGGKNFMHGHTASMALLRPA